MLLCLLLLAVGLRAIIPVGYMPDTAALRQGVVRISLCTSTGTVSIVQVLRGSPAESGRDHAWTAGMDHEGHDHASTAGTEHGGHDHSGQDHAVGAECPFWAAAHVAADLPPLAITPFLAALRDEAIRFPAATALPASSPSGPPLGSRAPPSA